MQKPLADKTQVHLLYFAVRAGDVPVVQELLEQGWPTSHPDIIHDDPLLVALQKSENAIVELLLDAGAQVNAATMRHCVTAAIPLGIQRVVEQAIDRNDISQQDLNDWLMQAACEGEAEMALRLLERGAEAAHTASGSGSSRVSVLGRSLQKDLPDVVAALLSRLTQEEKTAFWASMRGRATCDPCRRYWMLVPTPASLS